jgi:hypothetical protein
MSAANLRSARGSRAGFGGLAETNFLSLIRYRKDSA